MKKARIGDRVRVQFVALRNDGTKIKKRPGRKVLEFTVGSNEVIRGVSIGVVGMCEGDQKRLTLQPKDGYGAVESRLIKKVARDRFPTHLDLCVGKRLTAIRPISGRRRQVHVREVNSDAIVIDGNHPLAGKVLEVEIQLVSLARKGGDIANRV